MRPSLALALCLLAAGTAQATPTFAVDELPLPFGGEVDHLRLSESGVVVGCMERGADDWLPFAWDPAHGRLLHGCDRIPTGNRAPFLSESNFAEERR